MDLVNQTAEKLPQGVRFERAEHRAGGWVLTFSAEEFEENHAYQLFTGRYYDTDGKEYEIMSSGSDMGDDTGRFRMTFPLAGYHQDTVWLCPQFSRIAKESTPVIVPIR